MARKFTKLFLGNIVYAIGRRIFRKIASIFTLPKPTLVIDGDEMIIGDASGLAEFVEIYANGEFVKRLPTSRVFTFIVELQGGGSGTHTFECEHGMTWEEFVNSDHNTVVNGSKSFIVDDGVVLFIGSAYGHDAPIVGSFSYKDAIGLDHSVLSTSKVGDHETYYYYTA